LIEAGANSEVDPIRIRLVDLPTMLPSRDPETKGADEKLMRVSAVGKDA
jgi:hypothetical protein